MTIGPQADGPHGALHMLRRFLQRPEAPERCELCSARLGEQHAHLLELSNRRLVCACDACAILFDAQGAGRFRRCPRESRLLADFHLADQIWQALDLPINLVFFLHESSTGRVLAHYPSPAGMTQTVPPADVWQMLVEDNPVLRAMQPDVEALLVNRISPPHGYYLVGLDECYKLAGVIRTHWRGPSGGTAVEREMNRFFTALNQRAQPVAAENGSRER